MLAIVRSRRELYPAGNGSNDRDSPRGRPGKRPLRLVACDRLQRRPQHLRPRTSRCSTAARWRFMARARRKWWPIPAGSMRVTVRDDRGMTAFVRQVLVIMAKDLRAELRTKEAINASLSF